MAISFFIILIVLIILNQVIYKDFFSVLNIYNIIWFTMIILYFLNLITLDYITTKTLILILVSILLNLFGALFIKNIYKEKSVDISKRNYNFKSIKKVINFLFFIYFISEIIYLIKVKSLFGTFNMLKISSTLLLLAQRDGGELSNLGLITYLKSLNLVIVVLIIWYIKNKKIDLSLSMQLIFIIYFFVCNPSRTQLISLIFLIIFTIIHFIRYKKINYKVKIKENFKLIIIISIGIILVIVFFYFMGDKLNKSNYIDGKFWSSPYLYIAGNIPALDKMLNNSIEFSHGKKSFYVIYKVLEIITGKNFGLYTVEDFVNIPYPFNTYTSISIYYSDFGIIGIILLSFFVSIFVNYIYIKYSKRKDFFAVFLLSYIFVIITSTFNVNKLPWFITWLQIGESALVAFFINKFCLNKK
ncbi:O-antigen polymerase [Clostridium perfringens]|nr:O-antigen polymerase [Clostridium perfringens]MDM0769771.1 O-antigen polymerase [Clostridium perfringens]